MNEHDATPAEPDTDTAEPDDGPDTMDDDVAELAELLSTIFGAFDTSDDPDPTKIEITVPAGVYGEKRPALLAEGYASTRVVPDDGRPIQAVIHRVIPDGLLVDMTDEESGDQVGSVLVSEKALFSELILAGLATLGRVGASAAERQAAVDRTNAAAATD